MVGVEGPRAWWSVGLARHAGHTEAVLQQRQLFTQNHQEGEGGGTGHKVQRTTVRRGGEEEEEEEKVAGGSSI